MRRTSFLLGLVSLFTVAQSGSSTQWPRWTELDSQVCVERPGDNGLLNIVSARILIDGWFGLVLPGERAGCLYIEPGKHKIWAESSDPYDRESAQPRAWKSNEIEFSIGRAERLNFEVCGAGPSGYSTWVIERARTPRPRRPCIN